MRWRDLENKALVGKKKTEHPTAPWNNPSNPWRLIQKDRLPVIQELEMSWGIKASHLP